MDVLASIWPYVAALLPSAGLAYLFYVIMKHIVEGDRRERIAQRQWEAEQDAAASRSKVNESEGDRRISRNGHS